MSGDKRTSKKGGRGRKGAVAALGVAGALSLSGACGASASPSPANNMPNSTRVLLAEEEISDVSLSTFYVFDKESARLPGVQFAAGHGCGGHGCGGRGCGARGCGHGCGGCGRGWRGCGGCGGLWWLLFMGWPRSRLLSTVGRLRVHLLDGLATGDGAETSGAATPEVRPRAGSSS